MKDLAAGAMQVLVLDDEPSVRILLQEVLTKDGYQVQLATSIQEAQAICQERKFDLLVVDKNLPDGNGLEFIEWAGEHYDGDCESVIITSYATLESSAEAIKMGVADYILKPFGHSVEVLARIGRISEKLKDQRKRKQAELALRESEERLKIIFDHAPDGYFLHDVEGNFLDGNKAAEDIIGRKKEELIGKNFLQLDLLEEQSLTRAAENLSKIVNGQIGEIGSYTVKRPDGNRVHLEISSYPYEIHGKRVVMNIARDVSERRQIEQEQSRLHAAIENAANEWRQTVDAIASPILLMTLSGEIIRTNQAAQKILGQDYQEYLGKNIRDIGSGQPWSQISDMVEFLKESGITEPIQIRDARTGKTWDLTATLSARTDSEDVIIIVAHDVSEVVDLHELLRRNAVTSAMGSLLAGVAHEVRNPLFGITATLDAFEARYEDQQDFQRYFRTLRSELGRITDLMKDLLEYGKPISLGLTRGSLEGVIANAVDSCKLEATESGVQIVTEIAKSLPSIRMDEGRMLQAFRNIIENAVQHSPSGEEIVVKVKRDFDNGLEHVTCVVSDAGKGFLPEDLSRVFDPFFSRRRGGTGLGLSIVQRIIDEHMGTINVGNLPEGGGVITMQFPAIKS